MTIDLLKKSVEQETEAKAFGFYWESADQILEQVRSECTEIEEAISIGDQKHLKEEVGDLLNAAISLCIFLKFDPFDILDASLKKFQTRYDIMKSLVKQQGLEDLNNQPLSVLLNFWEQAKNSLYTKEKK